MIKKLTMKIVLSLLAATAAASKSRWLTDFDGMLAGVGCFAPKQCGASNFGQASGEECGPQRGCFTATHLNWEMCVDVAQWQCFKQCDEGEQLDPLQYCKCVPDSQLFDTFCEPPTVGSRIDFPAVNPTIGIELDIKGLDGATCESNDQCVSDVCDAGFCITPETVGISQPAVNPNGGIQIDIQPRGGLNIAGDSADGAFCLANRECRSGVCDNF